MNCKDTCVSMPVALITGAGSPGAVGIIRHLSQWFEVVAVDSDPDAAGFQVAEHKYPIPTAESNDFIPRLLEICKTHRVRVLFPKVTAELRKLAKNRNKFKQIGTEVIISSESSIAQTNNKAVFLRKCKESGIPVPEFIISERFCSKPAEGSGSRGFQIYEAKNQVVMEYLPGDEYSVDVLCQNGNIITSVCRVREKIKSGVTQKGTVVQDKEILGLSEKIVKLFNLNGIIGIQFKRDSNGIPKVLECNPRIQGTIMLSETSGAKMFTNAYRLAIGTEIEPFEIQPRSIHRFLAEYYE